MAATHTRTVDGVEVHHLDVEGPLTAELVFRVGAVDETVSTLGLSHLLEHLALDGVEGLEPDVDGESAMTYTVMRVRGTPERVADRLERICARLSALAAGGLSDAELIHARRVLEAEGGSPMADGPHAAEHLHHRLGAAGFGLGAVPVRFLSRITPAAVADWAGTRFTAGNAMLVLSGTAPQALRLPLPSGARRPLPETPFLERPYPAEYLSGGEEPSVSFVLDDVHDTSSAALVLLLSALRARVFRTLRQERGIVYDVAVDTAVLGRHGLLVVIVRCAEKDSVPAVEGVLDILRGLRDGGVGDDDRRRAAQEYEADEDGIEVLTIETRDGSGGEIPVTLFKQADRLRALVLSHLPERLRLPEGG